MADADDSRDEESWLYGDSVTLPTSEIKKEADSSVNDVAPPGEPLPPGESNTVSNEASHDGAEPGELKDDELQPEQPIQDNGVSEAPKDGEEAGEEEEEDEDDDSEDDIHVTIGDIKTAPQYPNLIKRGAQLSSGLEKLNKQGGKFSIEEFESIGTINGVLAHEFSIDALDEKPWRKPGADITDYFNYGFNEDTWRAYCERQKQMRVHESGVGLGGLGVSRASALTVVNENSKYASTGSAILVGGTAPGVGPGQRKSGPTSSSRRAGVIDVIGTVNSRRSDLSPPKENPIQVMTGDSRRDYNRKSFDMSVPPPGFEAPPPMSMVPNYPTHGGYGQDYYNPEMDPYYGAYEPSQDMQWGGQMINPVWSSRHRDKKSHSSSHSVDSKRTKYSSSNPVNKDIEVPGAVSIKQEPSEKSTKERERDREQRHKERHRHRSRSRSGERSERSERRRKHKSRSRSPSHRSHKKKKSKKSERNKEGSD